MAAARVEPFQHAVLAIRERLRAGQFRPGERIAVTELADGLHLSATPVREALSRLSGEGLLEDRRGQGFFVRLLTAADIADLFRLSLAQLTIARDPRRPSLRPPQMRGEPAPQTGADPVRDIERRFETWISHTGSRVLLAAHRSVQVQLGPVRRLENRLFDDLAQEAEELRASDPDEQGLVDLAPIRRFHARRIALAPRLAELLQAIA
jgi:DNA-binding transcriptional MocR family regulator